MKIDACQNGKRLQYGNKQITVRVKTDYSMEKTDYSAGENRLQCGRKQITVWMKTCIGAGDGK